MGTNGYRMFFKLLLAVALAAASGWCFLVAYRTGSVNDSIYRVILGLAFLVVCLRLIPSPFARKPQATREFVAALVLPNTREFNVTAQISWRARAANPDLALLAPQVEAAVRSALIKYVEQHKPDTLSTQDIENFIGPFVDEAIEALQLTDVWCIIKDIRETSPQIQGIFIGTR